jgi:nicotinate-nucleotide adenylyltransferase
MCILACADNPNFFVSRIEIDRQAVTYTIDTMEELHKQYPNAEFFFILGTDAMESFPKWRDSSRILELCTLAEVPRSKLDISSTEIRDKARRGDSIRYLTCGLVANYISKHRLYAGDFPSLNLEIQLCGELSRSLYFHSVSVMDTADDLAEHYGLSGQMLEKVRIAGLLHDCAKEICENSTFEQIAKICARGNIILDEFFRKAPVLAHCYAGAVLAQENYGINDPEILSAIENHTFGKPDMATLDKIVYLADFIEPTRPLNEARKKAKQLAYENLDKAMIFVLKFTIEKNLAQGKPVYAKSLETLKQLEEKYGESYKT